MRIRGSEIENTGSWWLAFLAVLLCLPGPVQGQGPAAPALSQIAQIKQLSRAQAQQHLPVRVRGVVTYWDPATLDLCLQDESDGIWVAVSTPDLPLSIGRAVEITGVTSGGKFTRGIAKPAFKILPDRLPFPKPKTVTPRQFLSGNEDARRLQVEGVVQWAQHSEGKLLLWLRSGASKIQVVIPTYPPELEPSGLVKSLLCVRGVGYTSMPDFQDVFTTRLLVNSFSDDVEITGDAEDQPPAIVQHAIGDLRAFSQTNMPDYPLRISGVATDGNAEEITLKDSTGVLRVHPRNPTFTGPEYHTQADGFLETNETGTLILADAVTRQYAVCKPRPALANSNTWETNANPVHLIITDLKSLRELPHDEAMKGYPVHLTGVVTWYNRALKVFCLQDEEFGVFVDVAEDLPKEFGLARLVEVRGYADGGAYAPYVRAGVVQIIAESRLPAPWIGNSSELASGTYDGRWVEVEGIIRSAVTNVTDGAILRVASAGHKFEVRFPEAVDAIQLPGEDAKIRVRGVCDAVTQDGQAQGFQVLVSSPAQVEQLQRPVDAARLPLSEIGRLFSSATETSRGHRLKVQGWVTLSGGAESLFISDGTNGLRIYPREDIAFKVGDRVEAIGFPALGEVREVLEDAETRRLSSGIPLEPVVRDVTRASEADCDSRLIKIGQVKLIESYRRGKSLVLVAQAGQHVFEARWEGHLPLATWPHLEVGSTLDLIGICHVKVDTHRIPQSFFLQLRSPDDLQSIVAPPINWTPRLLYIFGLAAAAICLSLLWVVALRRRVNRQTQAIREQLAHKAALERRYRQLIDNANDLVFIMDQEGRFISVNPACQRVTGYTPEEALRMKLEQWVLSEMWLPLRQYLDEQRAPGHSRVHEVSILSKGGRRVSLELSVSAIYDEGRITGLQGIARDITERRALEHQLHQAQKMESVGQLAAGIAHDFNNIMTVILGHGSLLSLEPGLGESAQESCQQVTAAAQRAADLTRQLLAFSRKQMMNRRTLDLNEIIANLTKMLARLLGEHIELKVVGTDLPAIKADAGMVEQIIINLAVNARDAMPQGGRLEIATRQAAFTEADVERNPESRIGRFVCLSVSDTGCGMDKATLEHLFEPFFTTKGVGKGTGLGLATVYGIVKQHEGWSEVTSEPLQGTRFDIFLPACNESPAFAAGEAAPALAFQGGRETILVVEDEPSLRQLVQRVLREHNYQVFSAATGKEALRVWQNQTDTLDLLLTDLVMPDGMSGRDLANHLRQKKPGLKVIYASGYSAELAAVEASLEEDIRFLPKPFVPATLVQAVRDCLDGKPGEARRSRDPKGAYAGLSITAS
jgi:PAS domain S-box-containing protein